MSVEQRRPENRPTRDRIAELELRYRRLGRLWAITATLLVTALVLVALVAADNRQLGQDIQTARERTLSGLCADGNAEHRALVAFVTRVAPDLEPLARRTFPQRSCTEYVRERLGPRS